MGARRGSASKHHEETKPSNSNKNNNGWCFRRLGALIFKLMSRRKRQNCSRSKPRSISGASVEDLLTKLRGASYSGLDIGGTLSKVAFFYKADEKIEDSSSLGAEFRQGTLHLEHFETWKLERLVKLKGLPRVEGSIGATGGGSRKFGEVLQAAGLELHRIDELTSLVKGIDFLSRRAQNEVFGFPKGLFKGGVVQRPCAEKPFCSNEIGFLPEDPVSLTSNNELYPYLIVNMGSGTSILRVDSSTEFKRVGGTSLGGSHFLALARLVSKCKSFDEAIQLAMRGDSTQVDLLVGDIYGGNYAEVGLAATTIASSLGKLVRPGWKAAVGKANILKSLLLSETNEIGHLACVYADKAGLKRIMFTGGFCQGYQFVMQLLAVAVEFRSQGTKEALFLRHSGHGAAVGALLNSLSCKQEEQEDQQQKQQ